MAGFKKENVVSINNISNYIKKTYNVKYIYHATAKKGVYTKNIL